MPFPTRIRPAAIAAAPPPRAALPVLLSCACALLLACGPARAQSAPPAGPVFTPGLYEAESRNSALPGAPVKSTVCIKLADYAAFRDETLASYRDKAPPQFKQDCRLGDLTELKNGFTLSMQCQGVKSVLTYEFEKDLVRLTTLTLMGGATKPLATIVTTMRRVGECAGEK